MQTFDVLSPASHTASPRNPDNSFTPEKSAPAGEKFGDVMNRAMTGTSRESNADDNDALASEKSNGTRQAAKSKKSLPRNAAKDDATTTQAAPANSGAHISQLIGQIVPEDKETSEDGSETDADKAKHTATAGKTEDASKSISAQLLALASATMPVCPPPTPVQVSSATVVSKTVKGSSNPVLKIPTASKSADAGPVLSEKAAEHTEAAQPNSDPKSAITKDSADHSAKASPSATSASSPVPALQITEPHSDKASLGDALKALVPDPQSAQAGQAKTPEVTAPVLPADLNGTSAAKQDMTMKKAEKTPKVAGPAEQDLPGNTVTGSDDLPTGQKLAAKASLHGSEKAEPAVVIEPSAATRISTSPESAAPAITSAAVAPANNVDMRVLERTHDIVALHAMRLAETGSDSLHVVVKPGAGIQLSLELRQSAGGIEVHASLHKGDFEHLNQYWPQLQQRLEGRGVRVGALTTSENFSSTSHQQFQQSKQQSSQQDPLYAGAFAEFALAGSMTETPVTRAARATAYRGWETWA